MTPKSGKPRQVFVHPLAIWTDFALKSGTAVLDSAQALIARPKAPTVAVLPDADAARRAGKAKRKKRRARR